MTRFPRLHAVLDHTIYPTLDATEIATLIGLLERIETAACSGPATTDQGTE